MNGLWALNNQPKLLDFTKIEPTPKGERPVSMLLPAEDGDGKWPRAYNGAEHYELPGFQNGEHTAQRVSEKRIISRMPQSPGSSVSMLTMMRIAGTDR
ncbi:MAG: hypothetical protein H7318_19835 [Oligoflexus sp.]|nr:hypothetical protein [Oligoflexus sp.]